MRGRTPDRAVPVLGLRLPFAVVALCAPGVAALLLAAVRLPPLPGHDGLTAAGRLLTVVLLTAAAERPVTALRIGHTTENWTFGAAAVVLSLCLLPGAWVVLVVAVVAAVNTALEGHGLVKSAFQASNVAAGAALAATVAAVGGPTGHGLTSPLFAVTLAVGVTLGAAWSTLAVGVVVAAAQHLRPRAVLLQSVRVDVKVCALNIGLGLAVATVARTSPATLAAVPVVVVLLVLVQRSALRDSQEEDVWRQLEDAGRELRSLDEAELIDRVVARTAALIRCDHVELVLCLTGDDTRIVRHVGGLRGVDASTQEPAPAVLPAADQPTVSSRGGNSAAEVGLAGPDTGLGLLRAVSTGRVNFRPRELQVLTTYARTVAATLLNARLYADAVAEAERKAWQASHDTLTGLTNRSGLVDLGPEVDEAIATGERVAVLALGVDHFKEVNNTLGHGSGDRLLQHLGHVLGERTRRGDVAARLEGDTFALLLRGLPDDEAVETVTADVLRCVSEPVEHEDLRLSLECSLGYAVAGEDGRTVDTLLRHAGTAMATAKASPGSARRWRDDGGEKSRERLALSADLRAGLPGGEDLVLHYQPQVDLRTGAVQTVEALARWQHPTRGLLSPSAFVPVLEDSGLARPFTLAVLDAAVREAAGWKDLGVGDGEIAVAVNLSARNLLDRELPSDVAVVLARHGLPARQLVLEITETVAMSELEVVSDVLARLRTLGVQLSVDDFGTGYSSLKFLQQIAVNELKIDREFVSGMLASEADRALVRASVELGHGLGLRVVAEGVEQPEHLHALRELGCDLAQGFHLSPPVSAERLRRLLLPSDGSVIPFRGARRRVGTA